LDGKNSGFLGLYWDGIWNPAKGQITPLKNSCIRCGYSPDSQNVGSSAKNFRMRVKANGLTSLSHYSHDENKGAYEKNNFITDGRHGDFHRGRG
jgi:hypothetical protein